MESTTSEDARVALLTEDAGTALGHIEQVSNDLSRLIASLAEEANQQPPHAPEISELMQSVQKLSIQASEGSDLAAHSVDELAVLVMKLSDSVTDFKLPEED